jgi:hypothetical protein
MSCQHQQSRLLAYFIKLAVRSLRGICQNGFNAAHRCALHEGPLSGCLKLANFLQNLPKSWLGHDAHSSIRVQKTQPIHSQSHGLYKALSDRQRIAPWLSHVIGASPRDAIGDAKARKNTQKPRPAVVGVNDAVFAIAG